MFRPCIDLHEGRVKQIVGSSLRDDGSAPVTNFESDRSPAYYANLYRADNLRGGHVILLGPGNEAAAREALAAWPGGLQVGGGVNPSNARGWLDAGASHVIVTSYVFHAGRIDWDRLHEMVQAVGRDYLVIDLSCRKRDGRYYVVTDRWQVFTETCLDMDLMHRLSTSADEFLVHAADVEGKQSGIDEDLVSLLAQGSPIPCTYAGGVRSLNDMRTVFELSAGRVNLTIGSALDIFGGPIPYGDVVALDKALRED